MLVHALNKGPARPGAAFRWRGEQILQVAGQLKTGGAAVVQVVHQAHKLAAACRLTVSHTLGHQAKHRRAGVKKTRPGGVGNVPRQGGNVCATLQRDVTVPKRLPGGLVGLANRVNLDVFGKFATLLECNLCFNKSKFATI